MTDRNTRRDQDRPEALEHRSNGASRPARDVPVYRPDVDLYENERELLLVADLPGARAETIDVRYEDGTLTLSAHVELPEPYARRYLLREYGVGDYQRSFRVDERLDAARIEGQYAEGVLTLRLPKVEAARPAKVPIRGA